MIWRSLLTVSRFFIRLTMNSRAMPTAAFSAQKSAAPPIKQALRAAWASARLAAAFAPHLFHAAKQPYFYYCVLPLAIRDLLFFERP